MSPITIFAVAILVRAYTVTQIPTQGTTSPACIELVNRPTYPNLARIAKIQGTVRVHLVIAPDGVSTEFTRDSHSLLVREVTASLQGTEFQRCVMDLTISTSSLYSKAQPTRRIHHS